MSLARGLCFALLLTLLILLLSLTLAVTKLSPSVGLHVSWRATRMVKNFAQTRAKGGFDAIGQSRDTGFGYYVGRRDDQQSYFLAL
ncbi:hypothetical protein K503DRAFT_522753 [Rhizopogon vinicolor AM-OR11-026]|uniref:Uncharacterized protein n=1 Tax=Rhizopogon vinicolor AM-OR11-026 TaxID=1314800 RepID=A0A1B7MLI9_9AGAM|nr:hypothetical protein K503DRAFT_522753 [Rhizopogon vinicolor AM-OR11-026]